MSADQPTCPLTSSVQSSSRNSSFLFNWRENYDERHIFKGLCTRHTISPSAMSWRANRPHPCMPDLPKQTRWCSVLWNLTRNTSEKIESIKKNMYKHKDRKLLPANVVAVLWKLENFHAPLFSGWIKRIKIEYFFKQIIKVTRYAFDWEYYSSTVQFLNGNQRMMCESSNSVCNWFFSYFLERTRNSKKGETIIMILITITYTMNKESVFWIKMQS